MQGSNGKRESKVFLENATVTDKHKDFQSTLQKYPEIVQLWKSATAKCKY